MKIGKLYTLTLFIGYIIFLICGITFILINNGIENSFWKAIIILIFGGIFYIPVFAISNLTQFILVGNSHQKIIAFFSPILIIGIISLIGISINKMDDFLWKIFIPAQTLLSFISYCYYEKKTKKGD